MNVVILTTAGKASCNTISFLVDALEECFSSVLLKSVASLDSQAKYGLCCSTLS